MAHFSPKSSFSVGDEATALLLKELMADKELDLPHSPVVVFSADTNKAVAVMMKPEHGTFTFDENDNIQEPFETYAVFDIDEIESSVQALSDFSRLFF